MKMAPAPAVSWYATAIVGSLLAFPVAASVSGGGPQEIRDECLSCHGHPDASMALEDGTTLSLFVDPEGLARSVHGSDVVCTDCHERYDEDDHPRGTVIASRRAYVLDSYLACRKCHFDAYTRTLESVHYELLKSGSDSAPVCTDCHGSHDIHDPHERPAMLSRSCASCHVSVYQRYAESVHGRALLEGKGEDVPACADCHAHHRIEAPGDATFRLRSPELCIGCHADEARMAPYGISTRVAETYLADFHGVTASLTVDSGTDPELVVVTCADCHGIHDIASPRASGGEDIQAKVATACARCHADASPDFPAAWLSHYEPSLQHAPLVFLVDFFYRIFIPFIVIGLALQVILHLYRLSAGR